MKWDGEADLYIVLGKWLKKVERRRRAVLDAESHVAAYGS